MKVKNNFYGRSDKLKILLWLGIAVALFLAIYSGLIKNKTSAGPINNAFYIDCSAGTNGNGSIANPWNTPQSLYDHQRNPTRYTFVANDHIFIKSGTICNYPIRLFRGSGTPGNPVVVTSYDSGARPIINGSNIEVDNWDGPGKSDSSAVQIRDFDNVTIENLEITNTGGDEMDSRRQGIWVFTNEAYGARRNITIRNNYIHNIWGEYKKNAEATAGISIEQRMPPTGVDPNPLPAWYENILIEDNVIENSNRQGINLWGDWRNRTEDGYDPTGPAWTAWTGVTIRNNTINHVRGDAILMSNTDGAVAENNTVNGFNEINSLSTPEMQTILTDAQTKQGLPKAPSRNHAGIWTYNTNNTIIQHNDVRGGSSNRDGMAFDIDGGSVGTIVQYNYSQDNDGGFALVCGELGQIRDGIIRYNISKNDGHASLTTCVGEVLNTEIYNNTIFSTDNSLVYPFYQVDWERFGGDSMNDTREIDIKNNIFSYPNHSLTEFFYNVRDDTGLTPGQVNASTAVLNNIYHGVGKPPQDTTGKSGSPLFTNVALGANGFSIFSNSPAYHTGQTVSSNGGLDYFGESIGTPPNIGASERFVLANDPDPEPNQNPSPEPNNPQTTNNSGSTGSTNSSSGQSSSAKRQSNNYTASQDTADNTNANTTDNTPEDISDAQTKFNKDVVPKSKSTSGTTTDENESGNVAGVSKIIKPVVYTAASGGFIWLLAWLTLLIRRRHKNSQRYY